MNSSLNRNTTNSFVIIKTADKIEFDCQIPVEDCLCRLQWSHRDCSKTFMTNLKLLFFLSFLCVG